MKRDGRFLCQGGASLVELLIALPMFVLLIFIIAELSLMYQAKAILDVAALAAARSGAIHGGDAGEMKNAAVLALTPLYTSETGTAGLVAGWGQAKLDTALPHAVGSTDLVSTPLGGAAFNGIGGGIQSTLEVALLSPTRQMVTDFGVMRAYVNGGNSSQKERVIPNDNLTYRDTKLLNGVNVQDANLLKIRVTYLYELKMPLTRYFFTPLMNANLTNVLFEGGAAGNTADASGGWRVPLVAYATMRMQSDFKEASLSAAASGGGSAGGGADAGGGSGAGGSGSSDSGAGNDSDPGLFKEPGAGGEENGAADGGADVSGDPNPPACEG